MPYATYKRRNPAAKHPYAIFNDVLRKSRLSHRQNSNDYRPNFESSGRYLYGTNPGAAWSNQYDTKEFKDPFSRSQHMKDRESLDDILQANMDEHNAPGRQPEVNKFDKDTAKKRKYIANSF